MRLRSPLTLSRLRRDRHFLVSGEERWPVIDGIAFLRASRRALADEALAALDAGDIDAATLCLLGDTDGGTRRDVNALGELLRRRDKLGFRDAMALLGFGEEGTYLAHHWSDPIFLSGLALAQSHWQAPRRVFEMECGAGHFLRAVAGHAKTLAGGDSSFSRLWLARHFVAPDATLTCLDADAPWPFEEGAADLLFCNDSFHLPGDGRRVAGEMMRLAPRVLLGHVRTMPDAGHGAPITPSAVMSLFPGCTLFRDRELVDALLESRMPAAARPNEVAAAPAVAIAWGNTLAGVADGVLTRPRAGVKLRRNPLYQSGRIRWPSEAYALAFADRVTYPARTDAPETAFAGMSPAIDLLARSRVLLDLPERW